MNKLFLLSVLAIVLLGCSNNDDNDLFNELVPEEGSNDSVTNITEIPIEEDSIIKLQKDSVREAYENDLSLEIKEIEEEKLDPINDECKDFLEEYASAIRGFDDLIKKIDKNPDNINLMMARSTQEEDLYSYSSTPQMFNCSQNSAFKKQVEILNNKRDKLISN